jgi:hypothetical protein
MSRGVSAPLSPSAVQDIEKLAQKRGTNTADERFKVVPDYAYPQTKMNREELRSEMNKKSAFYHDLALPAEAPKAVGRLYVEILQCFGVPKPDLLRETSAFCVLVSGAHAFKTDVMPPVANPMWLSKMRRACIFPVHHAYARLYIGVFGHGGFDKKDGFAGRVAIDIARLRPRCTYDVTLPLRQSTHVYSRHHRGAIRFRFHLTWHSERKAILSYLPKKMPVIEPNESVIVPCCDKNSFQNVARVVHGDHMPGRFSMNMMKAAIREINFTRIHVLRYIRKKEFRATTQWENPLISCFVFCAWMHCVYAASVTYVPGHVLTFLLLHLWKNYANYALDSPVQNGFLAPSWEEMMASLVAGSETRKFIAPLQMELKDASKVKSAAELTRSDASMDGIEEEPLSLYEIGALFYKGVKVGPLRHRWRTYRKAFRGSDAVDFLIGAGIANSRRAAVKIGNRLVTELHLFEHVTREHLLEDQGLFYIFSTPDTREFTLKTHQPWGKSFFRMLRFLPKEETLTEAQMHLEMPYSNGVDYPRFKVKDAVVIRSKRVQRLLSQEHAGEDTDEDLLGSSSMHSQRLLDDFINEEDDDDSVIDEALPENDKDDDCLTEIKLLKKPPHQDLEVIRKADRRIADVLAEARHKVHGVLLHAFNDRSYMIDAATLRDTAPPLAEAVDSSQRSTHGDCRAEFQKRTPVQAPTKGSNNKKKPVRAILKSMKARRQEKAAKPRADPMTVRKDEYDKLLASGLYSHPNAWLAKIGVIVQPIVEIILEWLCLFRALFNVFTWRDPILSFWISLLLPIVILILHVFPWRPVMGIVGLVLMGPQNWILRVMRERKPGYEPPDPDVLVKKKKAKVETIGDATEVPLFSNDVPDNQVVDRSKLDRSNLRNVVVPYSQLLYQRFYDWPPETAYARVKAQAAPENEQVSVELQRSATEHASLHSRRTRPRSWLQIKRAVRSRQYKRKNSKGSSHSEVSMESEAGK